MAVGAVAGSIFGSAGACRKILGPTPIISADEKYRPGAYQRPLRKAGQQDANSLLAGRTYAIAFRVCGGGLPSPGRRERWAHQPQPYLAIVRYVRGSNAHRRKARAHQAHANPTIVLGRRALRTHNFLCADLVHSHLHI